MRCASRVVASADPMKECTVLLGDPRPYRRRGDEDKYTEREPAESEMNGEKEEENTRKTVGEDRTRDRERKRKKERERRRQREERR